MPNPPLNRGNPSKAGSATKPRNRRAQESIAKMQAALLKCFEALVEEEGKEGPILRDMKPTELAACATAWDRLEDRRAVLKGHGKPKPVPATNDPGRIEPVKSAPVASSEEQPDVVPAKFG